MKQPLYWICIGALFILPVIGTMAEANEIISLNFSENSDNQGFAGGQNIGPLNTNSSYWNNTNGQPDLATGTLADLIDDNGNPTTAWVTWSSANAYWNEDGTSDDQHKMAVGYLDDGGSGIFIEMYDIPYTNYRVYGLYASDQSYDNTIVTMQDMQVNGTWVFGGTSPTSVSAYGSITDSFAQTGQYWSWNDGTTPGNYWTIDISGTSELMIVQSPVGDPGRASISALIIRDLDAPVYDETLKVVINRETGNALLTNNTGSSVDITGIGIRSIHGALMPGSWMSITDHYDAPPGDQSVSSDAWTISSSTPLDLSEGTLGTGTLAQSQSVDLGNIWGKYFAEGNDLTFEYLEAISGQTITGVLDFTGNDGQMYPFGDLNFDGEINLSDWPILRDNNHAVLSGLTPAQSYRLGDMDGDGDSDVFDFDLFVDAYDAANGEGAFAADLAAIPEPSTLALMALGLGGLFLLRRRHVLPMSLFVVLFGLSVCGAQSVVLQPFGVSSSAGGDFIHTIDGAGVLDPALVEMMAPVPTTWPQHILGDSSDENYPTIESSAGRYYGTTTNLAFDLGPFASVEGLAFWNYDERYNGEWLNERGIISADVEYSADGGATWTAIESMSFTIVPDESLSYSAEVKTFSGGPVRANAIRFNNALNDGGNFIGLGEIRFFGVPELLTLEVNTTTGATSILNNEIGAIDINYYQITSASHSLDSTGWSSLQDQDYEGSGGTSGNGDGWEESGGSGSHALAEGFLTGSSILASSASINLGSAFDQQNGYLDGEGKSDLVLTYRTASGLVIQGHVEYVTGTAENADFDGDGDVDGADFLVWQAGFGIAGTGTLANGDANNDTNVDSADLAIWKSQFGTDGASAGPASTAVPEPGTFGLLGLLLAAILPIFFRHTHHR
ncbi:MAG: PEP-CTERM sorting domain-containing protein [Pirellulales bacterium]|nr:PEP-CTERM sorting domain-containing protein [Pirellulales bacterium]